MTDPNVDPIETLEEYDIVSQVDLAEDVDPVEIIETVQPIEVFDGPDCAAEAQPGDNDEELGNG